MADPIELISLEEGIARRWVYAPEPDITPLEAARCAGILAEAARPQLIQDLKPRLRELGIERHFKLVLDES